LRCLSSCIHKIEALELWSCGITYVENLATCLKQRPSPVSEVNALPVVGLVSIAKR